MGGPDVLRLTFARDHVLSNVLVTSSGCGFFSETESDGDPANSPGDETPKWSWCEMVITLWNSGVDINQPREWLLPSRIIGRGSFGIVVQCEQRRGFWELSRRAVAAKVTTVNQYENKKYEEAAVRLVMERAILMHVQSQFVVTLQTSYTYNDEFWLVMELCDGGTVGDALLGIQSTDEIGAICACVTHALAHIHDMGICHRDIKSSNILLLSRGIAKLADFGVACGLSRLGEDSKFHLEKFVAGTLHYLAPECCCDRPTVVEARSVARDVWALGICVYEMFYGTIPYGRSVDPRTIIVRKAPPSFGTPPPGRISSSSSKLLEVIDFAAACLQQAPNQRKDAHHLAHARLVSAHGASFQRQEYSPDLRVLVSRANKPGGPWEARAGGDISPTKKPGSSLFSRPD